MISWIEQDITDYAFDNFPSLEKRKCNIVWDDASSNFTRSEVILRVKIFAFLDSPVLDAIREDSLNASLKGGYLEVLFKGAIFILPGIILIIQTN